MSGPARPPLRIGSVLREVSRAYARHWHLLVPLSLVVLLPQAVADATIGEVEVEGVHRVADVLKLASIPLSIAINLGGEALFAGIVAAAMVHWRAGVPLPPLRTLSRTIPYGRLIAVDLLFASGTAIGFSLLVVPGVLFFTYLLISPALVEVQHLSIREALRRSVELVQGNFWRVLAVAATVLIATDAASVVLESPIHGVTGEIVFNLAIEAALEPIQALTTVLLALALLKLHGEEPAPRWGSADRN